MVCSSVYGLCVVDEYATLHIPFSVHASSMFIPAAWLETRETAGRIDSSRHDQYRTQKGPPPLFCCATLVPAAADCTTAQSDGCRPTLGARSVFLPVRERVTSLPLPCAPHVGAGLPADRRFAGPFHLGTPPLSLGRFMSGGSQKCPPRFNYYPVKLYSEVPATPRGQGGVPRWNGRANRLSAGSPPPCVWCVGAGER